MVVVLPTPPFWLHIEITRAWPWVVSGFGSGNSGIGRPVGPSTTSRRLVDRLATSSSTGSTRRRPASSTVGRDRPLVGSGGRRAPARTGSPRLLGPAPRGRESGPSAASRVRWLRSGRGRRSRHVCSPGVVCWHACRQFVDFPTWCPEVRRDCRRARRRTSTGSGIPPGTGPNLCRACARARRGVHSGPLACAQACAHLVRTSQDPSEGPGRSKRRRKGRPSRARRTRPRRERRAADRAMSAAPMKPAFGPSSARTITGSSRCPRPVSDRENAAGWGRSGGRRRRTARRR